MKTASSKWLTISSMTVLAFGGFSATSCREKTPEEKIGDAIEDLADDVGDAVEDAADEVEDAARD